jgi:toxin ParE1/3/4
MLSYRLSKRAEKDLENIALYSIQNFGIKQARLYRDWLFKTFDMICEFPLIGSDQNVSKKMSAAKYMNLTLFTIALITKRFLSYEFWAQGEDPLRHLT